jgi:membrane fusion protein (multidrug efflux system)
MSDDVPADDTRRDTVARHVVRRGIPIVLLLLVVGGAYLYWRKVDGAPKLEAAPPPAGPVAVRAVVVRPETVPVRMRFLGQTEGSQVVEIRARVAGYLVERSFKEGERVGKGQKLFQIDSRPFDVALTQARAALTSAEATLARANMQAKRLGELRAQGGGSQQELEDWQTQARVAAAQVEERKAEIAAAELQRGYTSIESPIAGRIGRALKDTGSYVDAGQNALVAVVQQVDPMYVRYAVTEQEVLQFQRQVSEGRLDAPPIDQIGLEVQLSDGSVYPHPGRINFVDVGVDATTGTSVIRGQVPNPDDVLKPGQFVHATVLGVRRIDVMRVPQRAVTQSPGGASVLVVSDRGVAESRPVVLGEWSGADDWIVQRGLNPGDRVIIDRLMTVRPGTPVTVTAVAAATTAATTPSTSPSTRAAANGSEARP